MRGIPFDAGKSVVVPGTPGFQPFGYFLDGPWFHSVRSAGIFRFEVLSLFQNVDDQRMDAAPSVAVLAVVHDGR